MPVKWTLENDLLLLIKLLETHSISPLNTEKIITAWPSTVPEVPTPRAITDRIRFLRNLYTTGVKKENGDPSSSSTTASKKVRKNIPKAGKEKRRLNFDQNDSEEEDEKKDRKIDCILAAKEMKKEGEEEGFMEFKKEIDMKMHMEPIEIDDDDDFGAFGQGSITGTRSNKRKAPGAAHTKGLQGWEATTASAKMVVEKMKLKKHKSNGDVHNHQDDDGEDNDI